MTMYVDEDDLVGAIAKAREISEQYELYVLGGQHSSFKSLDDLKWMCQEHLAKRIHIHQFEVTSERAIEGIFLYNASTDEYDIIVYVHPGLLPEHSRFIQFKELFHVLLDADKYRSMDIDAHIEESQECFAAHESEPSSRVVSEVLAEVAAMEFAFPFADRLKIKQLGDSADYAALAREYKLPQVLIERYLLDSYMQELHGTRAHDAAAA